MREDEVEGSDKAMSDEAAKQHLSDDADEEIIRDVSQKPVMRSRSHSQQPSEIDYFASTGATTSR